MKAPADLFKRLSRGESVRSESVTYVPVTPLPQHVFVAAEPRSSALSLRVAHISSAQIARTYATSECEGFCTSQRWRVELHGDERQKRALLEHDNGDLHDRGGCSRQCVVGQPSTVRTVPDGTDRARSQGPTTMRSHMTLWIDDFLEVRCPHCRRWHPVGWLANGTHRTSGTPIDRRLWRGARTCSGSPRQAPTRDRSNRPALCHYTAARSSAIVVAVDRWSQRRIVAERAAV